MIWQALLSGGLLAFHLRRALLLLRSSVAEGQSRSGLELPIANGKFPTAAAMRCRLSHVLLPSWFPLRGACIVNHSSTVRRAFTVLQEISKKAARRHWLPSPDTVDQWSCNRAVLGLNCAACIFWPRSTPHSWHVPTLWRSHRRCHTVTACFFCYSTATFSQEAGPGRLCFVPGRQLSSQVQMLLLST
jgi:hypothetical protein